MEHYFKVCLTKPYIWVWSVHGKEWTKLGPKQKSLIPTTSLRGLLYPHTSFYFYKYTLIRTMNLVWDKLKSVASDMDKIKNIQCHRLKSNNNRQNVMKIYNKFSTICATICELPTNQEQLRLSKIFNDNLELL